MSDLVNVKFKKNNNKEIFIEPKIDDSIESEEIGLEFGLETGNGLL